jgi:hypothetical protein
MSRPYPCVLCGGPLVIFVKRHAPFGHVALCAGCCALVLDHLLERTPNEALSEVFGLVRLAKAERAERLSG